MLKQQKLFFLSIRYHKRSQTQDVKSQSTKPSLRKLAHPKCDSAFEQKTDIVPSREISGSSQNSFFIYNQKIKPSRAPKVIPGTYSTSFWKVSVLLKKQIFSISFRYHQTSQTQDVKSQSTKCSLQELAQPKSDSAFEQKTRIAPSREVSGSSQNKFRSYNQKKQQSRAQTDTLERTQRRFGKLVFSFW